MTQRLRCLVPFCRRTTRRFCAAEWICGRHWSATDRALRRLFSLCRRRWERGWRDRDWRRLSGRMWRTLKQQAIERAAGLA